MISLTYDWERAYIDAILETDDEKLTKRIDAAEAKLLARINEFAREYGPNEKPDPAFQPSVSCNPKKIRPDRKNILLDYFVAALVMSDNKSG